MRTVFLRRAAALLLALICCLSVLPAMAETFPLSGYATTNLNVRQQPSASATVLVTIPSGDMALITGESGNYYVVTYEGRQGYALKQYFRVVDSGISLPAITPVPETAGASSYEVLYSGSKGEAVVALQSALKELGFYSGKADGEFGSGTRSAVTAFQAKNGLSQTGSADAATQALLYEGKPKNSRGKATQVKTVSTVPGAEIKKDSMGPAVVKLQLRLKELGYYTGAADGVAGSGTVSAIKAFQKKNDLRQSNTADVITLALLYSDQALPAKTVKTAATPTPIPTAVPASTAATFPFSTYTTASVNLRKSASTAAQRITTVPKGAEIAVLSISGDFLKITYKGTTGYIVSEYAYVPPQYAPGKALKTDADAQKNYPYLQTGDTGKDVTVLQSALKELGFLSQTANGTFDAATAAALKAFQKANNIRQDGIAAPEVLKLIFEGKPVNSKGKKVTVNTLPNREVSELHNGQMGEQVVDLQQRLQKLGMYTGEITGTYGTATANAVKKFQETHKLTQDGKAGAKTLRLLYLLTDSTTSLTVTVTASPVPAVTEMTADNILVMRKGTKSPEVTRLQNRLKELGYYTGLADGVYSDAVAAAVKDFQKKSGLTQDGVAGLTTQQALYSDFAVSIATPAPTETPMPGTPAPIVLSTAPSLQTLKTGSKGDLVKALQTKLKELGYYTGAIDGDYGSSTASAVKEYQRRNGLTADGVAGEKTLQKLYGSVSTAAATVKPTTAPAANTAAVQATLLKKGDRGNEVRAMQARLMALGYLTSADGIYGISTYNAVVAFQKKNGLTADGVAGAMTLNRLNSENAISASGTLLIGGNTAAQQTTSSTSVSSSVFTAPSASQVQYANWYTTIRAIAKKMPDVVLYDPDSGLHFNLHMFSFGKHADSETPTAADTAILNQVVGVNDWTPKYVWVCFPDGQVYIGSIHSHGHEVDHTPNNNLEGHICLHFPRVMSEAEQTGPYAVSHQKEINWGWELTQAMAK